MRKSSRKSGRLNAGDQRMISLNHVNRTTPNVRGIYQVNHSLQRIIGRPTVSREFSAGRHGPSGFRSDSYVDNRRMSV
jgi:hypothetical protein